MDNRIVEPDDEPPVVAGLGPLASVSTVYETPEGRRCVVTFANRGGDVLQPVRNAQGHLWVGYLAPDGSQPPRWDEWERGWAAPEVLRPVGDL